MTAPPPTAATPEELAEELEDRADPVCEALGGADAELLDRGASMIRTQARQIEAQRAEIERLTAERDRARNQTGRSMDLTDQAQDAAEKWKACATAAEAALAASQERERKLTEALEAAMRLVEEYGCRTDVAHIADDCDAAVAMFRAALQPQETADGR